MILRCLKIYAPAIVLALWAVMAALRVDGDKLTGAMFALTAVAFVVHSYEVMRRRGNDWKH